LYAHQLCGMKQESCAYLSILKTISRSKLKEN
jgi:hypothetical protein